MAKVSWTLALVNTIVNTVLNTGGMSFGRFWAAGFWIHVWECCGQKWIKIQVRTESGEWFPKCPNCGEWGDWPLKD